MTAVRSLNEALAQRPQKRTADFSLGGKLEGILNNYFVHGEVWPSSRHWLQVYFDEKTDSRVKAVETVPENLIAVVDSAYQWAFVLADKLEKFRADTAEYGLIYIEVDSFEKEIFCCQPEGLSEFFRSAVWIDDDFLSDPAVPFDEKAFLRIDSGVRYLNPSHFSVMQLVGCQNDLMYR